MLKLIGLDILAKDDRRHLLVANEEGQSERIDGGRELERIYDRFLDLNCTITELRAGAKLVRQGTPAGQAFARFAT